MTANQNTLFRLRDAASEECSLLEAVIYQSKNIFYVFTDLSNT